MKELDYQPNEMARSLSKQSSNTIGVIVPHIEHPYFAKLISSLERAAYRNKLKILLFNSIGKDDREEEYIAMCRSNRVAGLILCSGSLETEKFKNLGFPVVAIERFLNEGITGIECDNYQGGYLAAEHLIEKGCRHLIHIGGLLKLPMPADQRKAGFEAACEKYEVDYDCIVSKQDFYDDMNYYSCIRKIIDKHPETDGIFASSDLIAAQVIKVCKERGILIPEQIRLVGYDDAAVAALATPGITTIRQPIKEMAEMAVSLLVQAGSGATVPAKTVFPVTLVEREST
jgi:LacI family sucrose operon transcriptional repressor